MPKPQLSCAQPRLNAQELTDDLVQFAGGIQSTWRCIVCRLPPPVYAAIISARRSDPPVSYTRIARWLISRNYATGSALVSSLSAHFCKGHHKEPAR